MTANDPHVVRVSTNSYIKFGQNPVHLISNTNVRKIMSNNPKVDLVYLNVYIKFDEILSICSQDIGRKRTFGANQ